MDKTELLGYTPAAPYRTAVAYFAMEYAIDQSLKTYAGGLGFLAGSHLRSAYHLQQDFIAVGLLWKYGYYDQVRDTTNHMTGVFIEKHYSFLKDTGIMFTVTVHQAPVHVKAYLLPAETFKSAPLFLLSTDIPENDELSRSITYKLYDANEETRIAQNIVLGIGGAMLLDILGLTPDVYHMNEGHAVALNFYLYDKFRNLADVKKRVVFTTHTPEMAGNEAHSFALLDTMSFFYRLNQAQVRGLLQISGDQFNYTLSALKFARKANGVSQMHTQVASRMWDGNTGICPIIAITNAQNQDYWADAALGGAIQRNDVREFSKRKKELKRELFQIVADQCGKLFQEDVLTIVWARRFAGYKRPELLMLDWDRFVQLVSQIRYPVQVIWAGKPYPGDEGGIAQFNRLIDRTGAFVNCAVLTGYELQLSGVLKRGADVWLNTPRLYHEASGTSGMTAAMNGTINLTIPDGWVPEFARDQVNCFCIPTAPPELTETEKDQWENRALSEVLVQRVLPLYYDRPEDWFQMARTAFDHINPAFESDRLARQYYQELYGEQPHGTG
ncbi:alpha-glucan family phosphorylase [Mucilaginibacter sp. KACC 22063]|uniref:alpha-glucan family phosphorylase n=1 Tax=Mucilaginibacter sp. KACC 22063 TaxID=3025666 RepID=UPI0023654B33|nr:alpha-glucan family phosphorylase [Mucilaginibacter sp. KACC 22063]WDF55763.1 alpha-glucan family phosphorylase [Mucilaginibacter sp. KACC 22063]